MMSLDCGPWISRVIPSCSDLLMDYPCSIRENALFPGILGYRSRFMLRDDTTSVVFSV
ncbi:MAG: hypothetical protein HYV63_00715 [Candidatus Schekmanbacteria bacterium]|nr:hypothetical protein [Candidatus Schekmanbacteria bacterium]